VRGRYGYQLAIGVALLLGGALFEAALLLGETAGKLLSRYGLPDRCRARCCTRRRPGTESDGVGGGVGGSSSEVKVEAGSPRQGGSSSSRAAEVMRRRSSAALHRLEREVKQWEGLRDASSVNFSVNAMEHALRRQVAEEGGVAAPWAGLLGAAALGLAAAFALPALFPGSCAWYQVAAAACFAVCAALANAAAAGQADADVSGACGQFALVVGAAWVGGPGGAAGGLVAAGVVSGAAFGAALAMYAWRAGFVVYAAPRAVAAALACGVLAGCLVAPAALLMLQQAAAPGGVGAPSSAFPAPLAAAWRANAAWASSLGVASALPDNALGLAGAAAAAGFLLAAARRGLPAARWIFPLPAALGVAFLTGANVAVDVGIGALITLMWRWRYPRSCDAYAGAVGGALIAGEGLWAVGGGLLAAFGVQAPICMAFS
jgi:hypothetical protein